MSKAEEQHRNAKITAFAANLNIFVPLFIFWAIVVGPFVATALNNLASILFQRIGVVVSHLEVLSYMLTSLGIFYILVHRWRRDELSPKLRNSERNFRMGHTLVAIGNLVIPVAFGTPLFIAYIKGNPELSQLEWFALPIIGVGVILWLIGVQMVKRSRIT